MRIIVWGVNYAPETVGIGPFNTALCNFLSDQGHEVEMVTTFPYYPYWKKSPQDQRCLYRKERVGSVWVHRCWQYVPSLVRARFRIVHEGSFVLSTMLRVLTLRSPHAFIVVSPPLLLGLAAAMVSFLKRIPFAFHVQDLQPDAAIGLGILKSSLFTRFLYWLESVAYDRACLVSGISESMVQAFVSKGVPLERTTYFPNGVELSPIGSGVEQGRFRARLGISEKTFLAVLFRQYWKKNRDWARCWISPLIWNNIQYNFIIAGEGAGRVELEAKLAKRPLANVQLLTLQSEEHYGEMLADADVCLIVQEKGSGNFFLPSKLLKILAHARPVFAVADEASPLVKTVREGGFGRWAPSHQPEKAAQELMALLDQSVWLKNAGQVGRKYVEQFDFQQILPEYAAVLLKSVNRDS